MAGSARRGLPPKTPEEKVYRKLLEMEEALLMWEEFQRDNDEAEARKLLLSKMVEAGFPGHEKYTMFSDSQDFQSLLTFIIKISNLRCLKRTGKTITLLLSIVFAFRMEGLGMLHFLLLLHVGTFVSFVLQLP